MVTHVDGASCSSEDHSMKSSSKVTPKCRVNSPQELPVSPMEDDSKGTESGDTSTGTQETSYGEHNDKNI